MPLYLTEQDVAALLTPADALEAVEESFHRLARGGVDNRPRERLPLDEGQFAVMPCVDRELGYAGLKTYAWMRDGTPFLVALFSLEHARLEALIEADKLGQLRTGAASGVAARHLARPGAATLGVIGCGWQAASQIACIRAAVPAIERVVVYCRNEERLAAFCARARRDAGRVAPRGGRAGRRRHRDHVEGPGAARRVAARRRARLRGRRERPGAARARQRRARARGVRLLRLARAVAAASRAT